MCEMQAEHHRVMITEPADEHTLQLRCLRFESPFREPCQHERVAFTSDQRIDHQPTRHAERDGSNHAELDASVLEDLVDTLPFTGSVLCQAFPIPRQITKLTDHWRWNETTAD